MKRELNLRMSLPALFIATFASLLWVGCNNPSSVEDTGTPPNWDPQYGADATNAYSFQQGDLQFTGNPFDLAIVGNGLMILKNDEHYVYFRRPARFVLNADGYITFGNGDFHLQGIPLWRPNPKDTAGLHPQKNWQSIGEAALEDISLPFHQMMPARATTEVQVSLNLSPNSMAKGSILYTQRFLHSASKEDKMIGIIDSKGIELGMKAGDILTFSKYIGNESWDTQVRIADSMTLQNLTDSIAAFLRPEGAKVEIVTLDQDSDLCGSITIYGNTEDIHNFQITSSRPISSPKITKAFAIPTHIPKGTIRLEVTTDNLRSAARANDPLVELFDTNGNALGLEDGDEISVSGTVGGTPTNRVLPLTFSSEIKATTMQDVLDRIQQNFALPDRDGTPDNNPSVCLNEMGSDDNIPDGSIMLRSMPGSEHGLGSIVISANNASNQGPTPNNFNANMNATTVRSATDAIQPVALATIFDAQGNPFVWKIQFTPTARFGEWLWEIRCDEGILEWDGSHGSIEFAADGNLKAWSSHAEIEMIQFNPGAGTEPLSIRIQLGKTMNSLGMTQFRSQESQGNQDLGVTQEVLAHIIQDGYAAGYRNETVVDTFGRIQGHFTNGQTRDIYQIPLADFPNKQGLTQIGTNSFVASKASGTPMVTTSLGENMGTFSTGYLEQTPVPSGQVLAASAP